MRVLWLSHFVPYPPAGGALQRAYHLLRYAALHHEVYLLALNQPRLLPTSGGVEEARTALAQLCASVEFFSIPAERSRRHRAGALIRSVFSHSPYDAVWLRSPTMTSALAAWRNRALDLVHVDTVGLAPMVTSWNHVPILLGHHNIESDLAERRAAREPSVWRSAMLHRDATKLRALERRAASHASMNVVVSRLDAARLREFVPRAAVEVVDNGVDTEYWFPTVHAEPSGRIVFAGTLGWYPNRDAIDFLLDEVWPTLVAKQPSRRLILVGRDPPRTARRAALDPRVEVTGFVPDVRPYISAADVCVCPIRVGGGTRLKVLDALAMGKPVVATAVAVEGLDLVAGQHYLLAETGAEFVAQIERLDSNAALGMQLGIAGRELVAERYDWRVIGKQLEAAYARAFAERPPPHHQPAE